MINLLTNGDIRVYKHNTQPNVAFKLNSSSCDPRSTNTRLYYLPHSSNFGYNRKNLTVSRLRSRWRFDLHECLKNKIKAILAFTRPTYNGAKCNCIGLTPSSPKPVTRRSSNTHQTLPTPYQQSAQSHIPRAVTSLSIHCAKRIMGGIIIVTPNQTRSTPMFNARSQSNS